MKRKLLISTGTLLTTACLLAACGNQPDTVPESQAIVSSTQELAEGAQDTAITAARESTDQTPPQAGETVSISPQSQNASNAFISETEAKKAAFDHAGVQEADVKGLRIKLDYDDGRQYYEVDFYANEKEYEYEINAADGSISSYDSELVGHWTSAPSSTPQSSSNTAGISEDEAIKLALEQVPGAVKTDITKYGLDQDDGRSIYEIEILYDYMEYDIEIDAQTGEILKFSQEKWRD